VALSFAVIIRQRQGDMREGEKEREKRQKKKREIGPQEKREIER
jgi:hypothetical protein